MFLCLFLSCVLGRWEYLWTQDFRFFRSSRSTGQLRLMTTNSEKSCRQLGVSLALTWNRVAAEIVVNEKLKTFVECTQFSFPCPTPERCLLSAAASSSVSWWTHEAVPCVAVATPGCASSSHPASAPCPPGLPAAWSRRRSWWSPLLWAKERAWQPASWRWDLSAHSSLGE